ncbi:RNA polymerase subunit sigma-24 [Amycolatopsis antarctica]|uniref:RNA polymerase subunit sigma-24 n=1 Tax=Amycolatopsis antarctica TaxID=1854586 RepID=A0A263D4R0_9PSEU|nr:sigma factor-like helix-turn-helix DNA-binding protein [Amycolatopsis antarctica]OZM73351.1 RNA polymerase subunit sigma-24 [Amycolatopsis antarctica]
MTARDVDRFEADGRRLFGLAYRLLGRAAEAEEVLRDAYPRWTGRADAAEPEVGPTTLVTSLCLDRLTSARDGRERYPGPWLPEPVFTADDALGPLETAERRHSVSFGLLVLLERCAPAERAAFVLREAFGHSHREIAGILNVGEDDSRQLHRRALAHVGESRTRSAVPPEEARQLVERFLAATVTGDVAGLEALLAAEAVAWSDDGGRASTVRHPVRGRAEVARMLAGLGRHPRAAHSQVAVSPVNGQAAVVVHQGGELTAVLVPEFARRGLVAVRTVSDPEKLRFAARQLV